MQDEHETPVIFRKFREGDVIALFPQEPGDMNPSTCGSYMHIGQHGAADAGLARCTNPATPQEYADLKRELEGAPYGYRLKLRRRFGRRDYFIRRKKIDQ